jgi:outer membrane protein OmpA-like peptidoglycan-associated protein
MWAPLVTVAASVRRIQPVVVPFSENNATGGKIPSPLPSGLAEYLFFVFHQERISGNLCRKQFQTENRRIDMLSRIYKTTVLGLCCLIALSACAINPYTGEKQASKAAIGAGVGAAGGALIGLISSGSKHRQRNVLLGAGLGALAGGGVGYYMDVQEAKLRDRLRNTGVSVTRAGNQIILNMPGNITFATDSADINGNFYNVLNSVALVLKEYPKTTVDVIGHTDSMGAAAYNQTLSERRARSVAQYLAGQGVMAARLLVQGMGESQPIASNQTPEGRAKNRRVVIRIEPLTS